MAAEGGLLEVFLAGIVEGPQLAAFKTYAENMKTTTPQAKKDEFKAKISAAMDGVQEGSDEPPMQQLIKGIKKVMTEAAKEKGMNNQPCDEDKAKMKENLKGYFSQPGKMPFADDYSGVALPDILKAMVGAFMAMGWKANEATN